MFEKRNKHKKPHLLLGHIPSAVCSRGMPETIKSAMNRLAGLLEKESIKDFDLMLFVNQNRRPNKKDPTLNLFAKVGPKKQAVGGFNDDIPNV